MVRHFALLCQATVSTQSTAISRVQLPLVLAEVNTILFANLLSSLLRFMKARAVL